MQAYSLGKAASTDSPGSRTLRLQVERENFLELQPLWLFTFPEQTRLFTGFRQTQSKHCPDTLSCHRRSPNTALRQAVVNWFATSGTRHQNENHHLGINQVSLA